MEELLLLIVTSLLHLPLACQGILEEQRWSEKDTEQRMHPRGGVKTLCKQLCCFPWKCLAPSAQCGGRASRGQAPSPAAGSPGTSQSSACVAGACGSSWLGQLLKWQTFYLLPRRHNPVTSPAFKQSNCFSFNTQPSEKTKHEQMSALSCSRHLACPKHGRRLLPSTKLAQKCEVQPPSPQCIEPSALLWSVGRIMCILHGPASGTSVHRTCLAMWLFLY